MTITVSLNNPEYMIVMLSLHVPLHKITSFLLATSLFFLCPHLTVAYIYDIKIISCQYISCINADSPLPPLPCTKMLEHGSILQGSA